MIHERYNPIPLNVVATKRRWSKDPAFTEAYDALADEFVALGELMRARRHADARCYELHTTPAPKAGASRR